MTWYNHWWLNSTLLGLLLGLGFVWPQLWFLGLFGIALYIKHLESYWVTWKTTWYIWFVKTLCVTSWIWYIYPIDWLGFSLGVFELPLIFFYWVSVAITFSLGGLLLYFSCQFLRRRLSQRYVYFAVPFFWLSSELLGSLLLSVLFYGAGGAIGTKFSMGYVGYLLAEHPLLLFVSTLAGVYGLTVIYVAVAVSGLLFYKFKNGSLVTLTLAVLVVGGVWLDARTVAINAQATVLNGPSVSVAIVDTKISETDWLADPASVQSQLDEALRAAGDAGAQYVIFPEDSRVFGSITDPKGAVSVIGFLHSEVESVVVDSGRAVVAGQTMLQSNIYDPTDQILYQSQKRYLVPQGEYMPYFYKFLLGLFLNTGVDTLGDRLSYVVGPNLSQSHYAQHIPGILFCFEVLDPRGVRKLLAERSSKPPFVAHIVSHAWINPSPVFRHQLETMLRVQSIWNSSYIVVAGNFVPGQIIDPAGNVYNPNQVDTGEMWQLGVVQIPIVD